MQYLIISVILAVVVIYIFLRRRKIDIWILSYLFGGWRKKKGKALPIHIIFTFVDHFEPHYGRADDEIAKKRMDKWTKEYPLLADKYVDHDGNKLKHTWFYPYDEYSEYELESLSKLCYQGYGEVEFHLHHKNDTSESLRKKIDEALQLFNKYGISITTDDKKSYAFIHGNWALSNTIHRNGENFCGVDDELTILKESGCFADFTFPAYLQDSQPSFINTIRAVKDYPQDKKPYNNGVDVVKNGNYAEYDMMLLQGPLMLNWEKRKFGIIPTIEDGNIHGGNLFNRKKIQLWLDANISVKGNESWKFIKVFTHGAPEKNHNTVIGDDAKKLFDYLVENYNDGKKYCLHFATAREMYNIVNAAIAGESGDPNSFRDYKIKKYKNLIKN